MKGSLLSPFLLCFVFVIRVFSFSSHFRPAPSLSISKTSHRRGKALFKLCDKSSSLFPNSCDSRLEAKQGSPTKTCKRCKLQYKNDESSTCRSHPGIYSGRLNRVNDVDTSDKEFFWSCCGEYELHAPGCLNLDSHCSYDDDDSAGSYSLFTGKRVNYLNRR